MSATPGKVLVDGVTTIDGDPDFVLKMVQARDPGWVNRVFFAQFDSQATWLDELGRHLARTSSFSTRTFAPCTAGGGNPSGRVGTTTSEELTA